MRFRYSPEFQGDGILRAANRKKPYRTLDERCSKCSVKGGRAKPCWPKTQRITDNPHGYPCPRREWPDADSARLSHLVSLGAHAETGHLFARGWEIEFGHRPRQEQRRLFHRLARAYGDEVLRLVFWPSASTE